MPGDTVMLKNITAGAKGFSGEVDKILEFAKQSSKLNPKNFILILNTKNF